MSFSSFLVRRLLLVIPVLLAVSFIVFTMVRLIPGNPVILLLGEDYTPEQERELLEKWGLDEPIHIQYIKFLQNVMQGDFGISIRSYKPVFEEIMPRFRNSVILAFAAVSIALVVGISAGIISAIRPYSKTDSAAMVGAMIGVSAPGFWLGLMLMWWFSVEIRIFPTTGTGNYDLLFSLIPQLIFSPATAIPDFLTVLFKAIRHIVLPAITLSAFLMAVLARQTRSSMLEVLNSDYIRTARSKGANERRVIFVHTIKNALIPVVTVAGVSFGRMLGGSIIVETVFSYNGLGFYLINAISERDYPVIQALIIWFSLMFTLVNLFVDVIYGWLDPRIAYE